MNLRTFIERPVFSAVISITIVILGIIGLFTLPVEQYPDIAPPTIMVSTTYYGASAETLQKSVIAPLEVNLIALLIKLLMTCFKRKGSVVMIVSVAGRSRSNSTSCGTFICWARKMFCNKGVSGCSVMLKTIVFDSIFERSSMSDISASNCSQFRLISDKNSLTSSFLKAISPSTSKLEKPTMAFNGVRIS